MKVFDIKPKKATSDDKLPSVTSNYNQLPSVTTSYYKLPFGLGRIILVAVVVGVLSSAIAALSWTNPTVVPPGGNLSGFLNTSSTAQTKTGALTINGALTASSTLVVGGALTASNTLSVNATTTLATTGGNVGIGTASPGSNLEVNAGGLNLTKNILTVKGGGSSGAYGFSVQANNGSELFKVDTLSYNVTMANGGAGNVGIGTTAPAYPLTVAGQNVMVGNYASLSRMYSGADTVLGNNVYADTNSRVLKQTNSNYYANWIRIYYNNGITFGTSQALGTAGDTVSDPAGTTNERMIITNAGNVGIGTATPGALLDVNGAVKVGGSETGNSTSDIKAYIQKIACQARRGVWVDNTGCTEYAYYTSTSGAWTASPCVSGYHLCTWGDLWSGGFTSLRRSGYWPATTHVWIAGAYTGSEQNMFYPWGYQNYNNSCVAGTHFMLNMLNKSGTNASGCYVDSYVNVSACCNSSQ